jgi:hypothetical protein
MDETTTPETGASHSSAFVLPKDFFVNGSINKRYLPTSIIGVPVGTLPGLSPVPTGPPPADGTRVSGKIPFDPNYFYQENAPVSAADMALFTKTDYEAVNVWGQLYKKYTNHYVFPAGLNVILKQLKLGDGGGRFEQVPYLITGTKLDGSVVLIYAFDGREYNTETVYDLPVPLSLKKISFTATGQGKPAYIKMFGEYTQLAAPSFPKRTRHPFGNQTGVNGFSWSWSSSKSSNGDDAFAEQCYRVLRKLGSCRIYLDVVELVKEEHKFRYKHNWRGFDTDALYARFKADCIFANICLQGAPSYMIDTWPSDKRNGNYTRPYGMIKEDVSSYADMAKVAFQFAARYGRNKKIDLSLVEVDETQPFYETASGKIVGMDLISLMEVGNELDKWWQGEDANFLGRQFAYFQSAVYDGHKGTMGKNAGIKTADPSMLVTNAGLASTHPDFLMSFVKECEQIRGYNADGTVNIPVDGYYSFHCYSSTEGGQYKGDKNRGMCIEQSAVPAQLKRFQEVNHLFLGDLKLVCGESGFDLSVNSPLRAEPPAGSGFNAKSWQGVLILRTALWYAKHGIYRNFFFTWTDDGPIDAWQFSSSGITSEAGKGPGRQLVLRPAAMYLIQVNSFLKAHVWQEQISASPLVDRWQHGDDVVYSLYYPSEENRKGKYRLKLPDAGPVQQLILNEGGEAPTMKPLLVEGGVLDVEVTEVPVFIRL